MTTRRHYSLIEIIAVLMIFVLVMGLAVTSMRRMSYFVTLDQVVLELKQMAAEARQSASARQTPMRLLYDPEAEAICGEENGIQLPQELRIVIAGRNIREKHEERELFLFFPDGSGSEQTLILELDGERVKVTLSPLTGRLNAVEESVK